MKTRRVIFEELSLVIEQEPHPGAYNMALDEVLLRGATQPLLRSYGWSRPAVSFGYFGRWGEMDGRWPGRELVRRWTGGGIVPHGEDLTYTLVVPKGDSFMAWPAGESYRAIHEGVVHCFDRTDVTDGVSLAKGGGMGEGECFASPVSHDVLAGGRKIAGAAQRRTRHGLLHQGSIQWKGLGADFAERLAQALARIVIPRAVSAEERAEAERLAVEKYGTEAWRRRF